ncbi:hypothetical protein [Hoeflea olei]|uniref:Uncharacterized protein n=1 Tax=Hoeflea olei TaxID=1480615 RepID=A0A1C1Z1C8_9HYPH|nr:hypothetical protein [Hoeflea olei]OCW59551.1 hypothetical protein AWJ14_11100 [Hoeflea olei]
MLDRYDKVLEALGAPAWLREYRLGAYLKDTFLIGQPAEYYGCPPALVPLTSNGSLPAYEGIWTRWFCDEPDDIRRYVCAGPEDDFLLEEVALDDAQFAHWLAVRAFVYQDGEDEAGELAAFCEAAGLSDRQVAEIDAHTLAFGDDPEQLHRLAAFAGHLPAGIGERPAEPMTANLSGLPDDDPSRIAYFELSQHGRSALRTERSWIPPWLGPNAVQSDLFNGYLGSGRLSEAWLTLNSTGWAIREARQAALALAEAAGNPVFKLQMQAWVAFTLDEERFIPDEELGAGTYENYDY